MNKLKIEVTPAQCTLLLISLQDYSRFSNNVLLQKMCDDVFFELDAQRRIDLDFFKKSVDAGEQIIGNIARIGKENGKS